MCECKQKPFMGQITNWRRIYAPGVAGLGYAVKGDCVTPVGNYVQTSFIVSHDSRTGIIETNNSIYYLVGDEAQS